MMSRGKDTHQPARTVANVAKTVTSRKVCVIQRPSQWGQRKVILAMDQIKEDKYSPKNKNSTKTILW